MVPTIRLDDGKRTIKRVRRLPPGATAQSYTRCQEGESEITAGHAATAKIGCGGNEEWWHSRHRLCHGPLSYEQAKSELDSTRGDLGLALGLAPCWSWKPTQQNRMEESREAETHPPRRGRGTLRKRKPLLRQALLRIALLQSAPSSNHVAPTRAWAPISASVAPSTLSAFPQATCGARNDTGHRGTVLGAGRLQNLRAGSPAGVAHNTL